MIKLITKGNEVSVVIDQIVSPTYAADPNEAIVQIIKVDQEKENRYNGIYHFSNFGIISWFDLPVAINEFRHFPLK